MSILDDIFSIVVDEIDYWQKHYQPHADKAQEKENNLMSNLEKTKDDYISKTTSGDTLSIDFKRVTDADIKNIAKKILSEDYANKKNTIEGDYAKTVASAENSLKQKKNRLETQIEDVNKQADEQKNNVLDKAMKNNTARSSTAKLQTEKLTSEAEDKKANLSQQVKDAEQERNGKVESATKSKEAKMQAVDEEYNANLTAKEHELQDLKESDSQYVKSFVDKRAAQEYSDDLVKLVTEFALSVPKEHAVYVLDSNKKIKEILTEDEIEYIKKMIS